MQDMIWKDQETRGQRDTRIWEEGHWGRGSTAQPASSGRTRWGEACVSSKYTEEGQEIILRTEVLGRRSQDHGGAPESSSFRIWRIFSREPGGAVPGLQNDPTEQGRWSPSSQLTWLARWGPGSWFWEHSAGADATWMRNRVSTVNMGLRTTGRQRKVRKFT